MEQCNHGGVKAWCPVCKSLNTKTTENKTVVEKDFLVECNVCKQRYKNLTGSTPCCGSIAWIIEDDRPTKKMSLFASIGREFKPVVVSINSSNP